MGAEEMIISLLVIVPIMALAIYGYLRMIFYQAIKDRMDKDD